MLREGDSTVGRGFPRKPPGPQGYHWAPVGDVVLALVSASGERRLGCN